MRSVRPQGAAGSGTQVPRVYQIRDGRRWRVVIGHEGRSIYVGTFASLGEADAAACAKRNALFTANFADRVSALTQG
jgi:hypothetical protein